MSDVLRKPVAGEPFQPSARQFGLFIDTARKVDELQKLVGRNRQAAHDPTYITVQNDSGAALGVARPVLGLAAPLIDPSDAEDQALERPVFSGVTPDDDHHGKFAVLQGPLDRAAAALAVISGITWVRLIVDDEDDGFEFADVEAGTSDALVAQAGGSAYILWREGGEGEQWALVRISNPTAAIGSDSGSASDDDGSDSDGSDGSDGDGSDTDGSDGSGDASDGSDGSDTDGSDGSDGDASDGSDGDGSDGDGSDADGSDADGSDGSDGDGSDADGSDGDGSDADGSDGDGSDADGSDGDADGSDGDGSDGDGSDGDGSDGCDGFVCNVTCGETGTLMTSKFSFGEAAALIVTQVEQNPALAQRLANALLPYL